MLTRRDALQLGVGAAASAAACASLPTHAQDAQRFVQHIVVALAQSEIRPVESANAAADRQRHLQVIEQTLKDVARHGDARADWLALNSGALTGWSVWDAATCARIAIARDGEEVAQLRSMARRYRCALSLGALLRSGGAGSPIVEAGLLFERGGTAPIIWRLDASPSAQSGSVRDIDDFGFLASGVACATALGTVAFTRASSRAATLVRRETCAAQMRLHMDVLQCDMSLAGVLGPTDDADALRDEDVTTRAPAFEMFMERASLTPPGAPPLGLSGRTRIVSRSGSLVALAAGVGDSIVRARLAVMNSHRSFVSIEQVACRTSSARKINEMRGEQRSVTPSAFWQRCR